jgi:hypothetical protein
LVVVFVIIFDQIQGAKARNQWDIPVRLTRLELAFQYYKLASWIELSSGKLIVAIRFQAQIGYIRRPLI